ncbi:hypothetical protein Ahy_B04g071492 [Arachis hypogaea]|uniref:Major facilitator superfamily (MFS) profile domain-containing protein n=1 Tax=Arachis hypogaea TaxID=3818 RepID=A0A444ZKU8_ARAHY|nr:hypothetical protein Ahy_B04g071492 [Arachis hypogaea]
MVAAFGGLIFGYDLGISGGVTSMDPFLKKFFPDVFDSQVLTLITSSLYLAALVASLCASSITRIFGRRLTMLSGSILFLVDAGFNAFAQKVWMLIVGRMLLGFGIGCANQSVPIYVSEVAPYKYRGALNMMFQLAITIGIFVANVLNYFFAKMKNGEGWCYSLGFATVPAVMIVIGAIFLPDSPSSLIERGKDEKAKQELIKIRGTSDVEEEFMVSESWFDSQVLTLFTSSLYLAALVASLCASSITRIFGRRLTILSGSILFLVGAGFNAFAQKVWMLIVGCMLLGFGIGCANQSVPIYVSEVAPYKYRGALNMMFQLAITIGIFVANVFNYFFAKMKNGKGWRYSLGFAAVPAVMIVIGAIFLPDSPSSLIERGKDEKAKQEMIKIRGTSDVEEEFMVSEPWYPL